MPKNTIFFDRAVPKDTDKIRLEYKDNVFFNKQYNCLALKPWYLEEGFIHNGGEVRLIFQVDDNDIDNTILTITACSDSSKAEDVVESIITINGGKFRDIHYTSGDHFANYIWYIPCDTLFSGENELIISHIDGKNNLLIKSITLDMGEPEISKNIWMKNLKDNIPISDVNIPGTHDAAAINHYYHTPYACHNKTITEQLIGGVRLFDVRLKVIKQAGGYSFRTCHGAFLKEIGLNVYQQFDTLLNEFSAFLIGNPKEFIVMSLKIDDWSSCEHRKGVFESLTYILNGFGRILKSNGGIPTVGEARGKVFLINRLGNDDFVNDLLGYPITWSEATAGEYANVTGNRFKLFVQDKYKGLHMYYPTMQKMFAVWLAFDKKKDGEILLNYASATWHFIYGVYVMGMLIRDLGYQKSNIRRRKLGWILFDYEFTKYRTDTYGDMHIVQLIISSNFNYSDYPNTFKVEEYLDS